MTKKYTVEAEFEKYRIIRDKLYKSDFDLLMEESEIYLKGDENE